MHVGIRSSCLSYRQGRILRTCLHISCRAGIPNKLILHVRTAATHAERRSGKMFSNKTWKAILLWWCMSESWQDIQLPVSPNQMSQKRKHRKQKWSSSCIAFFQTCNGITWKHVCEQNVESNLVVLHVAGQSFMLSPRHVGGCCWCWCVALRTRGRSSTVLLVGEMRLNGMFQCHANANIHAFQMLSWK